jgi:predicted RNA-binding Zn-ribbon protein involved in translation (DUF1610 family)
LLGRALLEWIGVSGKFLGVSMPKCPECGREIDELINCRREVSEYRFWLEEKEDEGWGAQWERVDARDDEDEGYECPECGALLFKTYKEAVAFLKGERA